MVMHQLKKPPKDDNWIGREDELAPHEIRRRIKGKVAVSHLPYGETLHGEVEDVSLDDVKKEEEKEEEGLKTRKVIEEMKFAIVVVVLVVVVVVGVVVVIRIVVVV